MRKKSAQKVLKRLCHACDEVIEECVQQRQRFEGCLINWGEVKCLFAERTDGEDNGKKFSVILDNAGSSYGQFHQFLEHELSAAGFGPVAVITV